MREQSNPTRDTSTDILVSLATADQLRINIFLVDTVPVTHNIKADQADFMHLLISNVLLNTKLNIKIKITIMNLLIATTTSGYLPVPLVTISVNFITISVLLLSAIVFLFFLDLLFQF